MKEIAIFGGAFDPPTKAHEGIIAACLDRPDIDEVWLMPSGQRPDKPHMSADLARLAMLHLLRESAFDNEERLVVTDFEQQLGQPNETRRTSTALNLAYPESTFWYVFGADTYHRMPTWEGGAELQRKLGLILISRPGYGRPPEGGNIRHLSADLASEHISSTTFREAHQAQDSVEAMVNPAVLQYIHEHTLYVSATSTGNI